MQGLIRLPLDFLKKIARPENKDHAIALYDTARKWNVQPSYYMFGPDLSSQDQFDIDFVINYIRTKHENELAKKAESEAV